MKVNYILFMFLVQSILFSSCGQFLEVRPDKSLVVPGSLSDLQALLNDTEGMNEAYPLAGELATDDYYVTYEDWAGRDLTPRNIYIWSKEVFLDDAINDWTLPYQVVFYANVALEGIGNLEGDGVAGASLVDVKGQALFFRAFAFHQLAQVFAPSYDPATAAEAGIPLRLHSDVNEKSVRASLLETYDRIIRDAQQAAHLLPVQSGYKTRPSKPAAYALLARVALHMADYKNAGLYADSCLAIYDALLDYNALDAGQPNPVPLLNDEVIFHSTFYSRELLNPSYGRIDLSLYDSYEEEDLRRDIFFKPNGDTSMGFYGNYAGAYILPFNGLATDEMYLIRAECFARDDMTGAALNDLNTLLRNRYRVGAFTPVQADDDEEAVTIILEERRKELLFRGLRWSDLRRLNREERFAVTLRRELDGQTYELAPNSPRYVFPIPELVIAATGMGQNP